MNNVLAISWWPQEQWLEKIVSQLFFELKHTRNIFSTQAKEVTSWILMAKWFKHRRSKQRQKTWKCCPIDLEKTIEVDWRRVNEKTAEAEWLHIKKKKK